MIPYTKKSSTYYFQVQDLSGGVNFSQQPENIHNSQLSDGKNVWYKNGLIKTRPKVFFNKENAFLAVSEASGNMKIKADIKNTAVIDGIVYCLELGVKELYPQMHTEIMLRYVSSEKSIYLGSYTLNYGNITVLPVQHRGNIFLYVHGSDSLGDKHNDIITVKKISEGKYEHPRPVTEEEIYTPLVLTNCWPCFGDSGKVNSVIKKGATQVEGFNLLGNRYKMQFSTFDASPTGYRTLFNESGSDIYFSLMEYSLPYTTQECTGDIVMEYIDIDGTVHNHSVECPKKNAPTVEQKDNADGKYLHAYIKGDICHICIKDTKDANGSVSIVSNEEYINNNMTVSAPCINSAENWEKVCSMTQAVWYGNNSLGINGGSRLFFCGGKDALVLWSDFENPLYFPENNYAYVGDREQRTTAFGKQGASLIIFKENEIYSTQYTSGNVTAEELINQSVIDITTPLAYFPMTLIHPTVGCDCPDSIQLCRNRLVFASSEGKIYTITAQNQFSERNVFEISELIAPRLKKEDLKNSTSADWNGNYLLIVKNRVYVMDYNSYGYVNISSYTKEDVGNRLIPWFCWELNDNIYATTVIDGKLLMWVVNEGEEYYVILPVFMDGQEGDDEKLIFSVEGANFLTSKAYEKIPSLIVTKYLDFNEPHRIKVIEKVLLELKKERETYVTFITDSDIPDAHSAFINSFVPINKYTKKLGISIYSEGMLSLNNITVLFRKGNVCV